MTACKNPHTGESGEQDPHTPDSPAGQEPVQLEVLVQVGDTADQAQRKLLVATLLAVPDKSRAAELLGMSRRTLYDRMQKLKVPADEAALREEGSALGVREAGDELDIQARQLVRLHQDLSRALDQAGRANCWVAPGFDAIQMVMDLEREVRGRGGRIPQEQLYADRLSAKRWIDYEQDPAYLQIYKDLPLEQAAAVIGPLCTAPLAVLSLGPGGGSREILLVQHLQQLGPGVRRLYLLDLSQPLLARALTHAEATLPRLRITGIQGNMDHLPRYEAMLPFEDPSVCRLVTMLGGTWGNLKNEIEFLRDALGPLQPGDLLLFDACLRPPEENEDPRLVRPLPPKFLEWLTTPLRQYRGLTEIPEVHTERTEETTVVRGSYAVDFIARVVDPPLSASPGVPSKPVVTEFRLATLRRYDQAQLVGSLGRMGWQHRASLVFGGDYPRALLLFQKGEVTA